jgi:hypothetical protein
MATVCNSIFCLILSKRLFITAGGHDYLIVYMPTGLRFLKMPFLLDFVFVKLSGFYSVAFNLKSIRLNSRHLLLADQIPFGNFGTGVEYCVIN